MKSITGFMVRRDHDRWSGSRQISRNTGIILFIILTVLAAGCKFSFPESELPKIGSSDGGAVVKGYAYDPSGDNSDIEVTLEPLDSGRSKTVSFALDSGSTVQAKARAFGNRTRADNNGYYEFSGVEKGRYVVHAKNRQGNKHGFQMNINVEVNVTIVVNVIVLGPVGNISGNVTLDGDESDLGIMVYIAGTSYMAMSDMSGNYVLSNVPEGTDYNLVFAKDDYLNAYETVSITAGETTEVPDKVLSADSSSPDSSTSWHTDYGDPNELPEFGQDGDLYLDLDSGDVWEKLGEGLWVWQMNLTGPQGPQGEDGTSIIWLGTLQVHPTDPQTNYAYYNETDGVSYIYANGEWQILAQDGLDGENGADGLDGLSIVWMGELSSPPTGAFGKGPQENWAYYDIEDCISYIYDGTEWDILAMDGEDGEDGLSIVWKGERTSHPSSPQENWAYYNSADNKSYIYDGNSWEILSQDVTAPDEYENLIIGDRGPAGGLVFYDKGSYSNGWRYMEAAPRHTEWLNMQWGPSGILIGSTSSLIGYGDANTEYIVSTLDAIGFDEWVYAAKVCDELVAGGYDDWFLPSTQEVQEMNLNLDNHNAHLGQFVNDPVFDQDRYWSSTEFDAMQAFQIDFSADVWYIEGKYEVDYQHVRAARKF